VGKTSFFKALAMRPEWFASLHRAVGKDGILALHGPWIIELEELAATKSVATEALNSFITRTADFERPPWGRVHLHLPRRMVFGATTNEKTWLQDHAGARRWLPINVGRIELDEILAWREQLWAEARAAYLAGEDTWIDPVEFREEQESVIEVDEAWTERIASVLETGGAYPLGETMIRIPARATRVTIADIIYVALQRPAPTLGEQRRVQVILGRLGWVRDGGMWVKGLASETQSASQVP
jgi:predicted P-loop ATPase